MNPQKIQIKLFAQDNLDANLESYIPVFHRFIREDTLDEMMMDVADYTHVPRGIGVLLVGHAADVAIDQGEDRPGLLFSRKREVPSDASLIKDGLQRVLALAERLNADDEVLGPKGFSTQEILIRFPDRLHVQNDDASFESVRSELSATLSEVMGSDYSLSREGEARDSLTIRATRAQ
jgi:hypothetical protein